MTLIWTKSARADLMAIHRYISLRSPQAANQVKHNIVFSARKLIDFPEIGRTAHRPNVRLLPVSGLPYILVYRIVSTQVEIGSVLDDRMDRAPDLL